MIVAFTVDSLLKANLEVSEVRARYGLNLLPENCVQAFLAVAAVVDSLAMEVFSLIRITFSNSKQGHICHWRLFPTVCMCIATVEKSSCSLYKPGQTFHFFLQQIHKNLSLCKESAVDGVHLSC